MSGNGKPSKQERVLWVFLGYVLVGPVFAALCVGVLLTLMPLFQLSYFIPAGLPAFRETLMTTFFWSAIPSAIAGAIVVGFLLKQGEFSWIVAGVAGVLGFTVAGLVSDVPFREALPYLALLAGCVSVFVREVLELAKVIDP